MPAAITRASILPLALTDVTILGTIGILAAMGQPGWCDTGFSLWTASTASHCTSQHLADPYSTSHVLHGVLFYAGLALAFPRLSAAWRFLLTMVLEAGWEILENTPLIIDRYRAVTASLDYYGDSILNSAGDLAFCALGFWLTYKLPWRVTLALLVVIETAMAMIYRDNLALNILMLLWPLDAVREWQLGA